MKKLLIIFDLITFKKLLLICLATSLFSCQKQPGADFTTDKAEYIAGEVVKLTNTSAEAATYKWTFPDGQTSTSENIEYTIAETQADATLAFNLEAFSKNGKKTDKASKSISVKAATGQLTVWTSNQNTNYINVTIDGVASGTITLYYTGVPACSAQGCVTATLKVGSHTISATDGNTTWNGVISVGKNNCSTFELQ